MGSTFNGIDTYIVERIDTSPMGGINTYILSKIRNRHVGHGIHNMNMFKVVKTFRVAFAN